MSSYPDQMTRFMRNPAVLHSMIEGDVVALSVSTGECVAMPGVTADIWAFLETPRTVDELIEQLTSIYDVSPNECRRDLVEVLSAMEDAGIIGRT